LLVKLTNQSGLNFYWEYEGRGHEARCIHTWGDGGILEYWTQYEEGKTATRNSLGHTTEYYYDAKKLIHKITDANGGVTRQLYNEYDELVCVTNPEGLSVKYVYNRWGKLTRQVNENDEAASYTYDAQMNLTGISSAGGLRKGWQYDDRERIVQITGIDGSSLHYHYDDGLLTRITDNRKRSFLLQYDSQYNVVKLIYPDGSLQSWAYDDLGRTTAATDKNGNITRYNHDRAGNIVWIGEGNGNGHRFEYDAAGNLVHAKDERHDVKFGYGPLGVLRSRTQNGSTVAFAYDTELQLRSIANEGGEVYRFGLDALGQVANEWGFDGLHRSYIRDGAGRVKKVIRPSDRWSSYDYDGTGNIVKEDHFDGTGTAYRYNSDGMLTEAVNQDGHIKFVRDAAGRVIKEQQGKYEVTKKYDKYGNCAFTRSNLGAAIENTHTEEGYLQKMTAGGWSAAWHRDKNGLELHRQLSG
jgi:YD repeat-containing protein